MKNFTCIFIFSLSVFFANTLLAQFQTTIGGNSDRARSIVQTTDGGYAVAGETWSFGAGLVDFYIVKLDSNGLLQWTRTVGGPDWEVCESIVQTTDGGFAVAGRTLSFGAGNFDMYIIKLDSTGNIQWTRTVGGVNDEYGESIVQTTDGGYAIVGLTSSFGAGKDDLYIVKLGSSGIVQWTRTVGGLNWDSGHGIVQTIDGGYATIGETMSFGAGNFDLYIVKLDTSGIVQWTRTVGGLSAELGWSKIVQTTDSGYAVGGYTDSFGAGDFDLYIVKLDSGGIVQWARTVGGANDEIGESNGIVQTTDGGYAIAGHSSFFGAGNYDMYIVKLDGSGNLQWTRTVGGANDESGNSIVQTTDGGYAVAGFSAGGFLIVKLDSNGNTCANQGMGGSSSSGGSSGTGGLSGSGGISGSGGVTGSGGVMNLLCPCSGTFSSISQTACNSYTSPSGIYIWTASGMYMDTIFNVAGCDSVITLNLTVYQTSGIQIQEYMCSGDSLFVGNDWQTTSGTYYDTLNTANGCDSIVETILNILSNTSSIQNFTICFGDSVYIVENWQSAAGTYYDTLIAYNGCDSIITSSLTTILPPIVNISSDTTIICSGEATTLFASEGTNLWSTGDTTSIITVNPGTTTSYYLTVYNEYCSSDDSIIITVLPLPAINYTLPDSIKIFPGATTSFSINAPSDISISWSPSNFLSCTDCTNPIANPDKTITYYLTITSSNGCSVIDSVTVIVEAHENIFFIPSMFSPNGDGNNDVFRVRGNNITEGYIAVYNRWGEKIYDLKFTGNDLNDISKWWNGTYKGKSLNTAVFVYFANVSFTDGKIEEKKGNITLIR